VPKPRTGTDLPICRAVRGMRVASKSFADGWGVGRYLLYPEAALPTPLTEEEPYVGREDDTHRHPRKERRVADP